MNQIILKCNNIKNPTNKKSFKKELGSFQKKLKKQKTHFIKFVKNATLKMY